MSSLKSPGSKSLYFAALQFLFAYLIQLENYFFSVFRPTEGFSTAVSFVVQLPFFQFEHILFASLLGLLGLATLKAGKLGQLLAVSSSLLVNLYLTINQVGYSVFLNHLQPRLSEGRIGSIAILFDSFVREVRPVFFVNLLIACGLAIYTFGTLNQNRPTLTKPLNPYWHYWSRQNKVLRLVLLAYLGINIWVWRAYSNYHLENHPLIVLAESYLSHAPTNRGAGKIIADFDHPVLGHQFKTNDENLRAPQNRKQPNIIFIILESVGSKQLFPKHNGQFDPIITPNLAKLAPNMTVFDTVYTIFPGTSRAHVALSTGGADITWGSVYDEFNYRYTGPTLNSFMQAQGYETALISAGYLEVENIGVYYKKLNYDFFYEPADEPQPIIDKETINSWGLNEHYVMQKSLDWASKVSREHKPFFLQLLTISTHHPYSIPRGFKGPIDNPTNHKQDYLNSISYSDSVIGFLMEELKAKGLLDNTLICLTGDHGEAFEEWHKGNFLHSKAIFDENVKSFFAVIDPLSYQTPILSKRVGSTSDIFKTIATFVDPKVKGLPGRNLFAKNFPQRLVFFHKTFLPDQWGVRDGNWKFIENQVGAKEPQLYNLTNDPDEQVNLIKSHHNIEKIYSERIRSWYIATNNRFTSKLEGYHNLGGVSLMEIDVTTPGPKLMAIGYRDKKGDFHESSKLSPQASVAAKIQFVASPAEINYKAEWISPSGKRTYETHKIVPKWTTYTTKDSLEMPIEEGKWTFLWKDPESGDVLLKKEFLVSQK